MSTKLPEEPFSSFSRPQHSSNLSYPPSGAKSVIEDRVGRLFNDKSRSALRNHPYLRRHLPRLQNDPSNMTIQSFARSASPPPISAHLVTPVSMVLPSLVHPSPLQQTRLVTRESQHHRLVRLFEIPEFFRVVREGWGAAVRAEKCASTSAWNEEQNTTPGPSDNESTC
ncbi:hypothetical protein H2248_000868 [Termitomyces sp. 'cryptogamus']|nr:hypothetical protein H2248_000868 [Termitomyces sp. 'cryptogamus']